VFTDTSRNVISEMQVSPTRQPLKVTTKTVSYTSSDGTTIPAFVSRPDNDKNYPAVVYVHGGLGEPALDQPGRTIAAAGFVVITPGYRGTAYAGMTPGEAETEADVGHMDTQDVLAGSKWLLAHENTTGKTILIGSSLGGGIANELAYMYPDNWKAVVDLFGITDWACVMKFVSYGQSSAWVIGKAFGGTPETVPEEYKKYSPIYHANQVKAPFYIAQGLQDTTFPPGESQQWADALRANGVDVTFKPYAGETHGFILDQPFESPSWQDLFNWMNAQLR
jgi:dipeptidyl aminopeptidase/acylaminoacyl peptidase